jgi:hypothetical protein
MISLIVCSVNDDYLSQLRINLAETIGVDYELLVFDNKKEKKGICEVYNLLAQKARFEICCFLHEDIVFQTIGWGRNLVRHYESDPSIGAVGVAGAKYKSARFSGWYTGINEVDCANIIHRYPQGDEKIQLCPSGKNAEEVVCLDGVFIAVKKEIWRSIKFDEVNLKGFHFYDLDLSLRIQEKFKCIVAYDILMVHITRGGDFGDPWVETAISFHQRQNNLPRSVLEKPVTNIDDRIIRTWFDVLKHQRISFSNKWKWISKQNLFNLKNSYSVAKLLFYRNLGLYKIHRRIRKNG